MTRTFTYGDYSYVYTVELTERKTLGLEVRPNLCIIVRAPLDTSAYEIEAFLTRKWLWLEKSLGRFGQYYKTHQKKQYLSGESFYYLGRQYMLQVERDSLDMVKLERGKLRVYTTHSIREYEHTKKLLESWFAKRRKLIFAREYRRAAQQLGYSNPPQLRERSMAKRWGSHTTDSTIYLNPRLIAVPREAIYYVCLHELCHMRNKRHDYDFYRAMETHMPNWRAVKNALEINFG